jgi:hypothetical protein
MGDGGFGPFGWNVNCRLHTGRPGPGGCGGGCDGGRGPRAGGGGGGGETGRGRVRWGPGRRSDEGRGPGGGGARRAGGAGGGGGGAIAAGKLRRHSDSDWLGAKVVVAVKGVAAAGSGGAA